MSGAAAHRVSLKGGEWALWRQVMLRSAGFPAARALELASPECAAAADALLSAEARVEAAKARALRAVNDALDALRASGRWDDAGQRKPLLKLLWALNNDKPRPPPASEEGLSGPVAAFIAARADVERLRAAFDELYEGAVVRQSRKLVELSSDALFQEAVLWQNRSGFHNAIAGLARQSGRTSNVRRHEEMVASYLQRYCVKNDTIGFFGPQSWARLVDDGPPLEIRPGSGLLARRKVFLEAWGLEELARHLARDEAMKWWLAPRCKPPIKLRGEVLYVPGRKPTRLPPAQTHLIAACDGRRPARELAEALLREHPGDFASPREIYRSLEQLEKSGILVWEFEVPSTPQAPEALRSQLEAVGDAELSERGLRALDALEAGRLGVVEAAGSVEALDRAISDLEATFTRLTDVAATRRGGEVYAARTLVYEDCLRDVEVDVGPGILRAIEKPLELVLASARWYTARLAESYRRIFGEAYQRLVRMTGRPTVKFLHFWALVEPALVGRDDSVQQPVLAELHRRWSEILTLDPSRKRLDLTSEKLGESVARLFPASAPGWRGAGYHNPDLMLAAEGPEAVARGDFQLVLGELHAGFNTLNSWLFAGPHPNLEEMQQAIDADLPEPQVAILSPKDSRQLTTRTHRAYISPKDYIVPPLDGSIEVPEAQRIPVADLVLEDTPEGLVARTPDRRLRFDAVELFGDLLSNKSVRSFSLLGGGEHLPRITIDRVVVQREAWSFPAKDLGFASLKDPAARFLATYRWARAAGLPRWVFVKVPVEAKPFYVDFDSPIYVDLLAKALRRTVKHGGAAPTVNVSEMLPDVHQAWLPDAEGRRYTSELRLLATDLKTRPKSS